MQIADVAIEIDDCFAIKLQDHSQHTVRGRMLRPHVERHHGAVEHRLLSGGYFDLMHRFVYGIRCLSPWRGLG